MNSVSFLFCTLHFLRFGNLYSPINLGFFQIEKTKKERKKHKKEKKKKKKRSKSSDDEDNDEGDDDDDEDLDMLLLKKMGHDVSEMEKGRKKEEVGNPNLEPIAGGSRGRGADDDSPDHRRQRKDRGDRQQQPRRSRSPPRRRRSRSPPRKR